MPEQGASTRMRSKRVANGNACSASICRSRISRQPRRRRASRRWNERSPATTGLRSARILALPPGAAQASSTWQPGRTSSDSATRCELMSKNATARWEAFAAAAALPEASRKARGSVVGSTMSPAWSNCSRTVSELAGGGIRKYVVGCRRFAASSVSQSCGPSEDCQRRTSQSGWESRAAWSGGGAGGSRRSTAFASPAAELLPAPLTRSTASDTAA